MKEEADLTFADFLEELNSFGKSEWVTCYSSQSNDSWGQSTFYCALIPDDRVAKSLEDPSWDLSIGDGLPGFSFRFENGKEIGTYHNYSDEGVMPLVFLRSFHGMKDGYYEILEEFRHYFNLYEDRKNNKFIAIDDNGDDEEVISMSDKEIKIKLRLVKEFLAVKKMRLALFFDLNRFSEKTTEELKLEKYHEYKKGDDFVYSIGARSWNSFGDDKKKSQGFLMGKKLILGSKDFEPKLFNRDNKKFEDFIIGVDENGNEIVHTCDEEKLADFFGNNKGAPYFVMPVFFEKDVLTKYYSQPNKYSVKDGYLSCGGMWGLSIDNDHPAFVMAFLGDLGHLSHKEQLYWRSFNVATEEKMSYTAWARNFEVQFTDPEKSDLFFKQKFASFQEGWEKKFGWKFFRPPIKEDEHHFKTLRVPLTNEQREFDEQVLSLVKVFIDSLNEKELGQGSVLASGAKGIDKLEAFLNFKKVRFNGMIEFLRNLQELRSTGIAHLKGSNYEKLKSAFSIGDRDLSKVFDDIMIKCIWTLNAMDNYFIKR